MRTTGYRVNVTDLDGNVIEIFTVDAEAITGNHFATMRNVLRGALELAEVEAYEDEEEQS